MMVGVAGRWDSGGRREAVSRQRDHRQELAQTGIANQGGLI